MSRPLSRNDLLAEAARVDAEAEKLRQYAGELRRLAESAPLTIGLKRSKVDSNMQGVDLTGQPENVRTAGNRTRRASEAKAALLKAGQTDGSVAALLKVGRSTVNAWFGRLAIPKRHAETLQKKFGVPLSAWPRISD